jgi:hypothetical protein
MAAVQHRPYIIYVVDTHISDLPGSAWFMTAFSDRLKHGMRLDLLHEDISEHASSGK